MFHGLVLKSGVKNKRLYIPIYQKYKKMDLVLSKKAFQNGRPFKTITEFLISVTEGKKPRKLIPHKKGNLPILEASWSFLTLFFP